LINLYIISKTDPENWFVEHESTGKQGLVQASNFAPQPMLRSSGPKVTPEESEDAEAVLVKLQARSRKDKLGGFFGASGSEIEMGMQNLYARPNLIAASPKSPPISPRDSPNRLTRVPSTEDTAALNRRTLTVGVSRTSSNPDFARSSLGTQDYSKDSEKQALSVLLKKYPDLSTGRVIIRTSPMRFWKDKEKPIEKQVFLFSDMVVVTQRKDSKGKVKYKIEHQIHIQDAKINILDVATDVPANRGSLRTSGIVPFQIEKDKSFYTFMPPEDSGSSWLTDVKSVYNRVQNLKKSGNKEENKL